MFQEPLPALSCSVDTSRVTSPTSTPRLSSGQRLGIYLGALIVIPVLMFVVGMSDFESRNCNIPNEYVECDVAGVEGMVWAFFAFLAVGATCLVAEVVIRRRRCR